jgi:hypothetical protein
MKSEQAVLPKPCLEEEDDNSNRILCSTGTQICVPVDRPVSRSSETFITNKTNERRLMSAEMCLVTQAETGYTPLRNWKITAE